MLKQVILIEKTKFVYKLISSLLNERAVECFCLEQLEDFSYLVDDLLPDILLVDYDTASQDWSLFWQSVNSSKHQKFFKVLYGDKKELELFEGKSSFDTVLTKPLDITMLHAELSNLVK